jgi:hypothetical protein
MEDMEDMEDNYCFEFFYSNFLGDGWLFGRDKVKGGLK